VFDILALSGAGFGSHSLSITDATLKKVNPISLSRAKKRKKTTG
jgi:hypothetical protein